MYTGLILIPATKPTLSQTITTETPITTGVWQTLMVQCTKVNQDNKLLKKAYKKKAQQSQVLVARTTQQNQALATEAKTSTKDTGTKPTKVGKTHPRSEQQIVIKQLNLKCKLFLQVPWLSLSLFQSQR